MPKPLVRNPLLQPISRQHHKALQCCFKIRKGIDNGIAVARISEYVDYFFQDFYLDFLKVKSNVFKELASVELLKEYKNSEIATKQIPKASDSIKKWTVFEKSWYKHIRWQERVLLEWIQTYQNEIEIEKVVDRYLINENWCEYYNDKFWV